MRERERRRRSEREREREEKEEREIGMLLSWTDRKEQKNKPIN